MAVTSVICVIFAAILVISDGYDTVIDYDMQKKALDPDTCDNQLKSLSKRMERLFAEANSNVPRNIYLAEQTKFIGNFDKCLSIADNVAGAKVIGKYCRVHTKLQYPFKVAYSNQTRLQEKLYAERRKFRMSVEYGCDQEENSSLNMIAVKIDICIPAACEAKQALGWVVKEDIRFDGELVPGVRYTENFCRLRGDKPFSITAIIAVVIFTIILLLTILSTIYDLQEKTGKPNQKYNTFSILGNTRRLVSYRSSPGTIECADGIRVISLLMVMLLHKALTVDDRDNMYLISLIRWNDFEHLTLAGTDAVDTFFVLSGLFLVYTTLDKFTYKSFLKNLHIFYMRRLLRLWPLMAVCLLISSSFLAQVSDGASWNDVADIVNGCRLNWWPIMLFIQNQVKFCADHTSICLGHFWYITVDVQLYVVSPLLLMWLFGHRRRAWILLTLVGFLCVIFSAALSFAFNFSYPGKVLDVYSSSREGSIYNKQYLANYYENPLARASPFVIGMSAGYLLHCYRKAKLEINKPCLFIFWSMSLMIIVGIIGAKKHFRKTMMSQTSHNLMNGFSRTFWGLAIAWIVVACHNGYGGPANWFLSLRVWKLPSRLSYAMYLVHFTIIFVTNALETHVDVDAHTNIFSLFTIFSQSFVVAFVITILVECPVQNLLNIYLYDKFKTVKAKTTSEITLELQAKSQICEINSEITLELQAESQICEINSEITLELQAESQICEINSETQVARSPITL